MMPGGPWYTGPMMSGGPWCPGGPWCSGPIGMVRALKQIQKLPGVGYYVGGTNADVWYKLRNSTRVSTIVTSSTSNVRRTHSEIGRCTFLWRKLGQNSSIPWQPKIICVWMWNNLKCEKQVVAATQQAMVVLRSVKRALILFTLTEKRSMLLIIHILYHT